MKKTRNILIKICGITSLKDAMYAINAGADAIGFVFYEKSCRYINFKDAQKIIKKLPPFITTVGLFVNHDEDYVLRALEETEINLLQFHGNETADFCEKFNKRYIKAFGVNSDFDSETEVNDYKNSCGILFDTCDLNNFGGTGKSFDWNLLGGKYKKPMILAGGLNCDNIKNAIQITQPYGVDVSSGVEVIKGSKSLKKMLEFCSLVKDN